MSWTEDRIATLTKLWEGGATASRIAEELGGVSRNAVIGKAHRLGLKARPSPVKPSDKKGEQVAAATPAPAAPEDVIIQTPPAPSRRASPPPQRMAQEAPATVTPAREETPPPPAQDDDAEPPFATETAATLASEPRAAPTRAAAEPPVPAPAPPTADAPRIVSVGPGGFLRQGPGDQQPPIPPAPPRRLVPAKPSPEIAGKTSLLDLTDRVCRWPMGHPGEADFHFCGDAVNPGFPYCVAHCGRAYQAQLPRGVRRPPPPLPFGGPRVR